MKLIEATVVAGYGRQYSVEFADGSILSCVRRGKKTDVVVGDVVSVQQVAQDQGAIESIRARSSILYRSDFFREKLIAANVTQIVLVLAGFPSFSEELLNRCLIAAESQKLRTLILLNKCDMIEATARAEATLGLYLELGYPLLKISAKQDIDPLRPELIGQTSVLVGQSGMGKSTLINSLLPEAARATGEISTALDSGKHTTTHARLYHLDAASHIIDSPGLQEFGLHHLSLDQIANSFIEFRPYLGHCRFRNCRHLQEPGCALADAAASGKIDSRRITLYRRLASERRN